MPGSFSWFIDVVNNSRVTGWCFNDDTPLIPSRLSFFADRERIGCVEANIQRPDLKALKFHPNGYCGFEFTIPAHVDVYRHERLRICADDAQDPLKELPTASIPAVLREPLPKVFFMHIPKTAGTSFNTFAETLFPQNSAAVHLEAMDEAAYPALQAEKHYLAGHLPLRRIKAHFDLSLFDLYTIIREPYSHLHSHLKWVKRIGKDPGSDFFKSHSAETQRLALLLNDLDFTREKNVRALAEGICGDLTTLFDNHQTRYFLDYKRKKVAAPDVEIARAELGRFICIGMTENYERFLSFFRTAYGIARPVLQERLNRSESEPLFDFRNGTVRSILHPLVAHDLRLYQLVLEREPLSVNKNMRSILT